MNSRAGPTGQPFLVARGRAREGTLVQAHYLSAICYMPGRIPQTVATATTLTCETGYSRSNQAGGRARTTTDPPMAQFDNAIQKARSILGLGRREVINHTNPVDFICSCIHAYVEADEHHMAVVHIAVTLNEPLYKAICFMVADNEEEYAELVVSYQERYDHADKCEYRHESA